MDDRETLAKRLRFFWPDAPLEEARPAPSNVNRTWLVRAGGKQAVLQAVNPTVFPDLPGLMANFRKVAAHLAAARAEDPDVPVFPEAFCGSPPACRDFFLDEAGALWRLITYIGPSVCLDAVNVRQAAECGGMLARFHTILQGMAADALKDPLPGFHVTPRYLAHFDEVGQDKTPNNADEEWCLACIARLRPLAQLLAQGEHARQLVHGDPKAANFLFTPDGNRALSLIDLDTVRLDYVLHDLGDCLRSCCNPGGEDAGEPQFSAGHFAALVASYLAQGGAATLTRDDREMLVDSAQLLIFELGLRFFTDHLEGDRYFHCRYPGHNLKRAVTQFKLHASLAAQEQRLRRLSQSIR